MIPNIFVEIFELNGLLYVALTALIAGNRKGLLRVRHSNDIFAGGWQIFDPVTAIII